MLQACEVYRALSERPSQSAFLVDAVGAVWPWVALYLVESVSYSACRRQRDKAIAARTWSALSFSSPSTPLR